METVFFVLSKIAGIFLFPLPICLILAFWAGLKLPQKKQRIAVCLPLLLLWICSTDSFSQWLVQGLEEKYPPVSSKELPKADAIVVLGGAVDNMNLYSDRPQLGPSAERMTDAILLYKEGKAPRIVFTGGSGNLLFQTKKEAEFAEIFFLSFGIPKTAILLESQSRNTKENAEYTAEIFRKKGWKSLILITSAFHMERSLRVFRKTGLKIHPWPTDYNSQIKVLTLDSFIPSAHTLALTSTVWKERIGLLVYDARERISTFLPLRLRFPWSKD
ncbi:YdcF family protein [Leptospira fluminis]|uniref:YdcF family protein n=1 Tax=Leptospira fluminis TaxID=2484979 RepID=A0A4R9GLN4_9LEPT|nr:YdcF family protein [Leptospira fluminis]TGK15663.1 YdcF family protein [Leptospira fluminis]